MAQSPWQHGAEEKSTRTRKRARRFIFEHLHRRENDNVELKLLEKLRTCTETDPATDHQPSVNFKNENSMASCWEEEREKNTPASDKRARTRMDCGIHLESVRSQELQATSSTMHCTQIISNRRRSLV